MLQYVQKQEYFELLGKSIPDDFKKLVIEASSYINLHTHNRIDQNNPSKSVKYATCLIIDLIQEENKKLSKVSNLKSENIEGWSETYMTPEEIQKDYARKKYKVVQTYLFNEIGIDGLPLLYCGVC